MKLYTIKNYTAHIAFRDDGRKSGGAVYYVRENIQVKNCERVQIQGANVLKLVLQRTSEQKARENSETVMYLWYRDCTSSKHQFVESLEQELQNENGKYIILFGDININLLDENDSLEYLNMLMSRYCLSVQNLPTRGRSCLDHVFVNNNQLNVTCKILEKRITDHAIIDINVSSQSTHHMLQKKKIKITNEDLFQKNLREADCKWVEKIL